MKNILQLWLKTKEGNSGISEAQEVLAFLHVCSVTTFHQNYLEKNQMEIDLQYLKCCYFE